jgi:hypothetical protein
MTLKIISKGLECIESKYNLSISTVITDRAYGSVGNIQSLKVKNIIPYIPLFSTKSGNGYAMSLEEFGVTYNKEEDYYICQEGKLLTPTPPSETIIRYRSKSSDCKSCISQKSCILKKRKQTEIRHIVLSINQNFFEEHLNNMRKSLFQAALRERMWKIEGIHAEAKHQHSLKKAKYRGISKVQIQAYMTASVQNLKRLIQSCFKDLLSLIDNILFNIAKITIINNLEKSFTFI